MHRKGYKQFAMMTTDHKQITKKLHRIIMFTFCYFPGCEKYEVNHIDGNKLNNNLYNLEWATSSENTIHAINNGLKTVFGTDVDSVELSDEDVMEIVSLYDAGVSIDSIFYTYTNRRGYNISYSLIQNICHRKCRLAFFNQHPELL